MEFEFRNKRYKDAATGLEVFARELSSDWDGTTKVLSRELKSFLDSVATALERRHGGAWPGGTTATSLSKRSGASVASILNSVRVTGTTFGTIQGQIGGKFPLGVHEYGATIRAKGKMLTIPLPAALNSNGTPIKRSARQWENTFVARSKKGNLIIFQKRGAIIVPLYVLKDQVTIKPRLGMKKTLDTGLPYFVDQAMDAMVKAIVNKGT